MRFPILCSLTITSLTVFLAGCGRGEKAATTRPTDEAPANPVIQAVDFEDPSDGYFQGFLATQDGKRAKSPEEAFSHYQKALDRFLEVKARFPEWKTQMVEGRIALTTAELGNRTSIPAISPALE